jgi:hypothetical protein
MNQRLALLFTAIGAVVFAALLTAAGPVLRPSVVSGSMAVSSGGGEPSQPNAPTHVERRLATSGTEWECRILMPAMPSGGETMVLDVIYDGNHTTNAVTAESNYDWTGIPRSGTNFSCRVKAVNGSGDSAWSSETTLTQPATIGNNVRIASYNSDLFTTTAGDYSEATAWDGASITIEGTPCWWSYTVNGSLSIKSTSMHGVYFDQNENKLLIVYYESSNQTHLWRGYKTDGGTGTYTRAAGSSDGPPTLTIEEYTP